MADFCDVADLESFLQIDITGADQIASAEAAIDAASEAIRNETRQTLDLVEDDDVIVDGEGLVRKIFLPELPVTEVTVVEEDDIELADGTDYKLGQHGILHRVGRCWSLGIQNIAITYSHGYDPIPADIKDVCIRAASRAYQAGVRSSGAGAVPGIQSETLGDHSVTFEQGPGQGEASLGASAAPILLKSEMAILARYRI